MRRHPIVLMMPGGAILYESLLQRSQIWGKIASLSACKQRNFAWNGVRKRQPFTHQQPLVSTAIADWCGFTGRFDARCPASNT
jgi:hypothetical protein